MDVLWIWLPAPDVEQERVKEGELLYKILLIIIIIMSYCWINELLLSSFLSTKILSKRLSKQNISLALSMSIYSQLVWPNVNIFIYNC